MGITLGVVLGVIGGVAVAAPSTVVIMTRIPWRSIRPTYGEGSSSNKRKNSDSINNEYYENKQDQTRALSPRKDVENSDNYQAFPPIEGLGDSVGLTDDIEMRILEQPNLRLNQVQVLGTHNSIHVASLFTVFVAHWRFTHQPLIKQLEYGLRHIELDIWFNRTTKQWVAFHECVDRLTVCPTSVTETLAMMYAWSKAKGRHFPLSINLDIKGAYYRNMRYVGRTYSFKPKDDPDRDAFARLDEQILLAWDRKHIMAPSDVAKDAPNLSSGLRKHGWPLVKDLCGKAFFTLNLYGCRTHCLDWYSGPNWVMFKRSYEGMEEGPDCAMFEVDNPVSAARLAAAGYIVHALVCSDAPKVSNTPQAFQRYRQLAAAGVHYFRTNYPNLVLKNGPMRASLHVPEVKPGPARPSL